MWNTSINEEKLNPDIKEKSNDEDQLSQLLIYLKAIWDYLKKVFDLLFN